MEGRYVVEITEMLLPDDAMMHEAAAKLAAATSVSSERARILLDMREGPICRPVSLAKASAIAELLAGCGVRTEIREAPAY